MSNMIITSYNFNETKGSMMEFTILSFDGELLRFNAKLKKDFDEKVIRLSYKGNDNIERTFYRNKTTV